MSSQVRSQLATIRRNRGVAAADLAKLAGTSRQTIYAIEAGSFLPNTEVALRLARALEVPVEALFSLDAESAKPATAIKSEVLSPRPLMAGQPVRVCDVDGQTVSVPVNASPCYLPEADGVIAGGADLFLLPRDEAPRKRLVLAGCDPATGLVARMVERLSGVELVTAAASSKLALNWLREGKVHIAGSHLEDAISGEFNVPYLRDNFPDEDFAVITFARWEEGFVVAPGNPQGIRTAANLAKRTVRFINREPGSGSRTLLDRLLADTNLASKRVHGYDRIAYGHLAAAYGVQTGDADCCLATRSAARAFGLDFVPIREERYDFVMRRSTLSLPAAQPFLDALQRTSLRRQLEMLAGYDTARTGSVVA